MKKTSLMVHHSYLEDVVKNLHKNGLMEIIDIKKQQKNNDFLSDTENASENPKASECANYYLRLSRLVDILKKIRKKKSGIKALLQPELPTVKNVQEKNLDELFKDIDLLLNEIEEEIINQREKIDSLKEKKQELIDTKNQIKYLKDVDLKLSDFGTSKYLFITAGKTKNITDLKKAVKGNSYCFLITKQYGTGKKAEWAVIVSCLVEQKENVLKIVREHLEEFSIPHYDGTAKNFFKKIDEELDENKEKRKKLMKNLRVYAEKNLNDLLVLREQVQIERARLEVPKNFAKTDFTFIIQGWVLEKNTEKLKKIVDKVSDENVEYSFETPSMNPDNPPTYVKTPQWAKSFKGLVGMFATPRYNELDPSIPMGIFFVLFFGVMLSDAGYGLILLFLSLIGFYKYSKFSETIKDWSFMGIWLGIVTTVMGLLTNGFFGNLLTKFFITGRSTIYPPFTLLNITFPVEPLRDPLAILTMSLVLGIIQLNFGVILGIYQSSKQKNYKKMLTENMCWIPLQIGGGLLIGNFILGWVISNTMFYIAAVLVVIGILMLFIAQGPVGFFDITGYVGDWLSYARLLALGLATAGMALAFNEVGTLISGMVPVPVLDVILLVVIISFAHLANLILQALGAGVHSLRLQYVEFFNRFYSGGGHEFSPFEIKRKYTTVKEEK
jgi:V/A-type H+/Na+-transporting ATPase subunit I